LEEDLDLSFDRLLMMMMMMMMIVLNYIKRNFRFVVSCCSSNITHFQVNIPKI